MPLYSLPLTALARDYTVILRNIIPPYLTFEIIIGSTAGNQGNTSQQ